MLNLNIQKNKQKLNNIIVSLYVLSFLIIDIGPYNMGAKNLFIVSLNIVLTIISIFIYFFQDENSQKGIQSQILKQVPFLFFMLVLTLIVEMINFQSMYNLRIPIFWITNLYMGLLIFNINLTLDDYKDFWRMFYHINLVILLYAVFVSLITVILPNNLEYKDGLFFLETSYMFGVSFRQQVYKTSSRFFSIFSNPTHFGEFAYLVFFLGFLNYKLNKEKKEFYAMIIAVFFALILSQTRAAILTSIFVLLSYIFLYNFIFSSPSNFKNTFQKHKKKMILGIVISSFALYHVLENRLGSGDNGRIQLYLFSWDQFLSSPITGHGTKIFQNMIGKHFNNAHAHNSYLQLLGSGGILYLFPYLLFYFFIIRNIIENVRNHEIKSILLAFVFSTILYQMVDNKVLGIHYQFQIIYLLYNISSRCKVSDALET